MSNGPNKRIFIPNGFHFIIMIMIMFHVNFYTDIHVCVWPDHIFLIEVKLCQKLCRITAGGPFPKV